MGLEQSINLDSKKRGRIVGITQKSETLNKWFLTCHERAAITSTTTQMCAIQNDERVGTHKEAGKARLQRDESDVQRLMVTFKSGLATNPFDIDTSEEGDCQPLINIISGVVLPQPVAARLVTSKKIDEEQLKTFVSKLLDTNEQSFWDVLPHVHIKTFASVAKKTVKPAKDKTTTVTADREIFGRLLIVTKARDVNLKDVLEYELSSVPYALAYSDGTICKNVKSELLVELETNVETLPTLPSDKEHLPTAHIIDALAMVQMVKCSGAKTFGELADEYYNIVSAPHGDSRCNRVDLVLDRYDNPKSIKAGERKRRGSFSALENKISGPNQPLPKQWDKYIANPCNKANLSSFLCERWSSTAAEKLAIGQQLFLGGGFKKWKCLQADHEGTSN